MANLELYTQLKKRIENKDFAPVYLLHGEEPFYIDRLSKAIINNALAEHERDFNLTMVYGNEADPDLMLEALGRYPMMAEKNVLVFREAQNMHQAKWARLEAYLEKPKPDTIFLIEFKDGKANANKKWVKNIKSSGEVAVFSKHYDNEIPSLIVSLVKSFKYRISHDAASVLAEYLGTDLEKIEMEIQKLTISIPLSKQIEVEDVREHIGFSKEFSVYHFVDALAVKDTFKSFQIAQYFGRNDKNNPLPWIISSLYGHFSHLMMLHGAILKGKKPQDAFPRMKQRFAAQKFLASKNHFNAKSTAEVIAILREYDAKFKGLGNASLSQGQALKEMTFKILNA